MNIFNAIDRLSSRYLSLWAPLDVELYKEEMVDLQSGNRERWSLFRSLHFVGDDTSKTEIQSDLKFVFDDETYALIEAIFQWNCVGFCSSDHEY